MLRLGLTNPNPNPKPSPNPTNQQAHYSDAANMARLLADAAAHRRWWVPARLHAAAQRMVSSMRFRMGVVAVVVANTALEFIVACGRRGKLAGH